MLNAGVLLHLGKLRTTRIGDAVLTGLPIDELIVVVRYSLTRMSLSSEYLGHVGLLWRGAFGAALPYVMLCRTGCDPL